VKVQNKNKEIVRDNQQEKGEILQVSNPADELIPEKGEEEEASFVVENTYSKLE
jgi:uncharacterized protein YcgL (UPF0745 family)